MLPIAAQEPRMLTPDTKTAPTSPRVTQTDTRNPKLRQLAQELRRLAQDAKTVPASPRVAQTKIHAKDVSSSPRAAQTATRH